MNIKVGDVLSYKDSIISKRKVLGICDDVYHLSNIGKFDDFEYTCTLSHIENNYILPEKPWEPVEEQIYWSLDTDGIPWMSTWHNSHVDQNRRNFLGIFPTQEAAEARRDEIKKLLKK